MNYKTTEEMCEVLYKNLKQEVDFFNEPYVVMPNNKMVQYFKKYWLKHTSDILINVKFVTFNEFALSILSNPNNYKIYDSNILKTTLSRMLFDGSIDISNIDYLNCKEELNYLDGIKCFDYASLLTDLFIKYTNQNYDIDSNDKQKEIYDIVIKELNNEGYSNLKEIFNESNILKINNKIHIFGFNSYTNLQQAIIYKIKSLNEVYEYNLVLENKLSMPEYSIYSCPTLLKEIEIVHSEICKLLNDKNESNTLSDFLIISNSLADYETSIGRVFKQNNPDFPNIQYNFNNSEKILTNVNTALKTLYGIYKKKYFTRVDLLDLAKNNTIQDIRGFNNDDVDIWESIILNTNTYRDSELINDWEYLKERLLSSYITDERYDDSVITLSNEERLPYKEMIDGSDHNTCLLIDLINDIQEFETLIKEEYSLDFIDKLESILSKFFSKKINDEEYNYQYQKMINVFNIFRKSKDYSKNNIDGLFLSLLEATKASISSGSNAFINGVTFINFDSNCSYSAKYIFLIGFGSNNIPVKQSIYNLDLNPINDKYETDYNGLKLQIQNTTKKLFISYNGENLQTQEKYYLSPYIYQLLLEQGKSYEDVKKEIIDIKIDEDRSWDNLFTQKEFKDKGYYDNIISINDDELDKDKKILSDDNEKPNMIKVKDIDDFINEPYMFKINYLFGKNSDLENDEKLIEGYEPLEINKINASALFKELFLSNNNEKNIINDYILKHKIPYISNDLANKLVEEVKENVDKLRNEFKDVEYSIIKPQIYTIKGVDDKEIQIEDKDGFIYYLKDDAVHIYQIKDISKAYFPRSYIYALLYIVNQYESNPKDKIKCIFHFANNKSKEIVKCGDEAKKVLFNMYNEMFDFNNLVICPRVFEEKQVSIDKFRDQLESHDGKVYKYFMNKDISVSGELILNSYYKYSNTYYEEFRKLIGLEDDNQ